MSSITKEVYSTDDYQYLIRGDREEMAFVADRAEALLIIDSLASHDAAIYEKRPNYRVFRQDLNNGEKVVISTQKLGTLYDGAVKIKVVFDMVKIPRFTMTKSLRPTLQTTVPPPLVQVSKSQEAIDSVDSVERTVEHTINRRNRRYADVSQIV